MEPISYLKAPVRRWPVLAAVTVIVLIVAVLIPVSTSSPYPANTWQAVSEVGLNPPSASNQLGATLGPKQLEFYARSPVVLAAAAQADGVPLTRDLSADLVIAKVKQPGAHSSVLQIAVLQRTRKGAADLTNSFVSALSTYAQAQLAASHQKSVFIQQVFIQNLEKAITSLPQTTKPVTTTTLPPVRIKTKKATTSTTKSAPRISRSHLQASLTAFVTEPGPLAAHAPPTSAVLVDTSTTVTTVPATTTTLPAIPGGSATTIPGGTTTPTTTLSLPNRTLIEENKVLSVQLGDAIGKLQKLQAEGTMPSGLKVVSHASPKGAVKLNPNPSALSNVWLRALLGILIGLLLGVLATWLLDGFDRRLRTSKRAEEVFGLPVVSEIPGSPATSSVIPVVDLVMDPYSAASEAYRRLHVAVLTVPTVTWVKRGDPYSQNEMWEIPANPPAPQDVIGAAATPEATTARVPSGPAATTAPTDPTGPVWLPVPVSGATPRATQRSRFTILVTSPTDEPSRSLVVVNLAAVFAEAGDRVLVATTGGMRTNTEHLPSLPPPWEGPGADLSASELVANARPSQIPGVSSLALGQLFANPSRLALKAAGLVEAARDVVDVLILEAPMLSTQDGGALLPIADVILVVCEAWRTTVKDGLRTQRMLAQRRPPVLGVVMTNTETVNPILEGFQTRV